MLRYIFKLIFAIFSAIFAFSTSYANVDIFDSTIRDNGIHPSSPFTLEIKYVSPNTINTNSANFQLRKYNGTSWGQNIAPAYVDLNGAIVTQFEASALVSKLPYGKYRFEFSISDDDGPSYKQITFFIDEPEIIIAKDNIEIGILNINILKLSNDYQQIKVKTIGAPYELKIINPQNLKYELSEINPYDGISGWGYKMGTSGLKKINNPEYLGNPSFKESINGNRFEDNYLFQFGAKNDDNLKDAGNYEGSVDFHINLKYCPEYESNGVDCKENNYVYIEENSGVKTWSDGTYAKTCNDYRRGNNPNHYYTGDTGDGTYMIKPDANKPAFEVYCDMSTNGGGWTQYVNIKGSYNFSDAKSCWLGNIISNYNLECFNPNRYSIDVTELYNDDWNGNDYFYNISNIGEDVSTQTSRGSYRCLGHSDFMTIMTQNNLPNPDGSDAKWIWLGKNYCQFGREVAGSYISNGYMNYDTTGTFGESSGAKRESFARLNKLYFRNNVGEKIVSYNSGRRWSDGTYARDCNEYKNPPSGYSYFGNTGDGEYYIDTDGNGGNAPYLATCNMTIDSGGWTLLQQRKSGIGNTYIGGDFSGGTKILMTYKRLHKPSENYAIKINQFKTRQCGNEHTTIADYVDHILHGTWGYCGRTNTSGDYNDIITEKVIEGSYVNDVCINGSLHKTDSRNADWRTSSGRGAMRYRFSNTTVLGGNEGRSSGRCAGTYENNKRWTEVDTWVR